MKYEVMGYKEFESHDGFAYTRLFDAPIEEIKRTYEAIAQMIFIAGGPLDDDIVTGLNNHMKKAKHIESPRGVNKKKRSTMGASFLYFIHRCNLICIL